MLLHAHAHKQVIRCTPSRDTPSWLIGIGSVGKPVTATAMMDLAALVYNAWLLLQIPQLAS